MFGTKRRNDTHVACKEGGVISLSVAAPMRPRARRAEGLDRARDQTAR